MVVGMQLTQHTDYGLRLLIVLARAGGGPVALTDFAAEQGLSYHHVAKVAQKLVREGFVASHRGRSGGVSLARPAEDVTVGQVVRALEKGMRIADCSGCALRGDCGTSSLLARALGAFMAVLDAATLADAARTGITHAPWAFAST
ncbi:Rrf2 family transcriptional regulator [Novosphingobium sp. RD2P27]|uniref:Rrf2 family transcriptional regulator n=1 Tax=Novosphingobium kalidii TaxID=3230299 RepID=A0ABV2D6T8_9SPHN